MTAHGTSERINQLAGLLDTSISQATDAIAKVNMSARMLAMNTRVEAARLGPPGATFQVIGGEMVALSERTNTVARSLGVQTRSLIAELASISAQLATQFCSQDTNHRNAEWFASAMAAPDGDAFGFESVHASALAGGKRVLVYSAKVCEGGLAQGRPLGVLGIVFKWDALAHNIVANTPVDVADQARTRALITDTDGTILADSSGEALCGVFPGEIDKRRAPGKGFEIARIAGRQALIGHARSPGFETYASGWDSYVVQMLE